jgi:hypothetical protein
VTGSRLLEQPGKRILYRARNADSVARATRWLARTRAGIWTRTCTPRPSKFEQLADPVHLGAALRSFGGGWMEEIRRALSHFFGERLT